MNKEQDDTRKRGKPVGYPQYRQCLRGAGGHCKDQVQKPENLQVGVLRQLAQGMIPMPDGVIALYDKHKAKGTRLSFNETYLHSPTASR